MLEAGFSGRQDGGATADLSLVERNLQDESGFQLVELLVVMLMLTFVLGGILTLLETTAQVGPRDVERGARVLEGRAAMERITRDVRGATSLTVTSASSVDMVMRVRNNGGAALSRHVVIDCSTGGKCRRSEGSVSGPLGNAETLITGVTNSDVFAPTPSTGAPAYVSMKLALTLLGSKRDYVIQDGVELRNAP